MTEPDKTEPAKSETAKPETKATLSDEALIAAAQAARRHAHAPYSKFSVGAVIQTRDGRFYTGCNIENASFGLTVCAERVALFKALSEGERAFRTIVIATDGATPTPPCGACRQVLWEFCGDIRIVSVNSQGVTSEWSLAALLPAAFAHQNLTPPGQPPSQASGSPAPQTT